MPFLADLNTTAFTIHQKKKSNPPNAIFPPKLRLFHSIPGNLNTLLILDSAKRSNTILRLLGKPNTFSSLLNKPNAQFAPPLQGITRAVCLPSALREQAIHSLARSPPLPPSLPPQSPASLNGDPRLIHSLHKYHTHTRLVFLATYSGFDGCSKRTHTYIPTHEHRYTHTYTGR